MKRQREPHPTMKRLQEALGTDKPAVIAAELGVSDQLVTNWAARGISLRGILMIAANKKISATWLSTGEGAMRQESGRTDAAEPSAAYNNAITRAELAIKNPMDQIHRALKALHLFEEAPEIEALIRAKLDRHLAQEKIAQLTSEIADLQKRSPIGSYDLRSKAQSGLETASDPPKARKKL